MCCETISKSAPHKETRIEIYREIGWADEYDLACPVCNIYVFNYNHNVRCDDCGSCYKCIELDDRTCINCIRKNNETI